LTWTEALDCPICGSLERSFPDPDKEVYPGYGIVTCEELEQRASRTVTEVGCQLIQRWAELSCDCTGPAVEPLPSAVFDPCYLCKDLVLTVQFHDIQVDAKNLDESFVGRWNLLLSVDTLIL
jgi:hypothetical protein